MNSLRLKVFFPSETSLAIRRSKELPSNSALLSFRISVCHIHPVLILRNRRQCRRTSYVSMLRFQCRTSQMLLQNRLLMTDKSNMSSSPFSSIVVHAHERFRVKSLRCSTDEIENAHT